MNSPRTDSREPLKNSTMYKEFLAEREEILSYKWIESEKAGYDIGFERALLDWTLKYRPTWCEERPSGEQCDIGLQPMLGSGLKPG